MKLFFTIFILTLFYFVFVDSFVITYSECHQRQVIKRESPICAGNGKCHLFFGCQCFDGFEGENCEIETEIEKKNGCFLNKCFEGSECIEISSSQYFCQCPENRYGNFCEFEDPCFGCVGKCYEIAEDIFECEDQGKIIKQVLNQSETINSTASSFNLNSTVSLLNSSTESTQINCAIADYCNSIIDNNICDSICNTEIRDFDFNDCNLKNDSTTVYLDNGKDSENAEISEYIFYFFAFVIILITVVVFLWLGKLLVKRWTKISKEIEAENAAIREIYFNQNVYCTI